MMAKLTMVLAGTMLAIPAWAQVDVTTRLAELKREPSIAAVQEAALRYYGLDREEVDSMRSRAAMKALLPTLDVSAGYVASDVDDKTRNFAYGLDRVYVMRGVVGNAKDVRGTLAWNLPKILYNPEVLDVANLANAREDIVKKVTDIYYARRHLQVDMALNPPADTAARINSQLRLEKLTSLLDAMTGGWFGRELAGDND